MFWGRYLILQIGFCCLQRAMTCKAARYFWCFLTMYLFSICSRQTGFEYPFFPGLSTYSFLSIKVRFIPRWPCAEDSIWFLSVLPDSVLQSLVLCRFICFVLLLWQQVVVVSRLRAENYLLNLTASNLACCIMSLEWEGGAVEGFLMHT